MTHQRAVAVGRIGGAIVSCLINIAVMTYFGAPPYVTYALLVVLGTIAAVRFSIEDKS